VVIPAYQAEPFLAQALESLRAQTYPTFEVIVVDDGSTDGTATVAARFAEVRCLRLGTNGGQPAARNAGIGAARGEFIAFLDADDVMLPECIEREARHLGEHPDCGCVLGRQEMFLENGATRPPGALERDPSGAPPVLLSAPMVRTSALRAIGGFDLTLRAAEDLDVLVRLTAAGTRIDLLDEVLVRRRFHGANASYDTEALRSGLLATTRAQIHRERARRSDTGAT
jgi:glycosyltransferase involved in cell wall biosynthesis